MWSRILLVLSLLAPVCGMAGNVQGVVTATPGGAGISGFEVQALSLGSKGWVVVKTALTNGTGFYTLSGLGTGTYIVRAVPPVATPSYCTYARRYYDAMAPNAGGIVESAADLLPLSSAGTTFTGINIAIPTVGAVEGQVALGGVGFDGVRVRVESTSDERDFVDGLTTTVAGTAGAFALCGVETGANGFWIHEPNALTEDGIAVGPYIVVSGAHFNVGTLALTLIGSDPYEPNATPATGTSVTSAVWTSNGAILGTRGSDVDFYCLDARAGDRYTITSSTTVLVDGQLRESPWFDPVLGWFAASPPQLLLSNDDDPLSPGSLNARIDTGVVTTAGRYCVGVTSYGDADFNGTGQISAGRYALRIENDVVFVDGFELP